MELSLLMACMVSMLIIHLIYIQKRRKASRSSLPLPPGPAGLPILGNLLYFIGPLRHNPHRALAALAETYGPIASFRPGMARTFVVVSSPGAARGALAGNDAALGARLVPDSTRALDHSAGSVVFLPSSDPLWRQYRATAAAHLFSARSLDGTRPVRDRHARLLVEHLRARSGRPVRVGQAVFAATLNAMSGLLFSQDLVDTRAQAQQAAGAQVFKDLIMPVIEGWCRPSVSDAFPLLAPLDLLGSRRRVARNLARLYRFLDEEIIERRLASGENHGDLLDVVLEQHAKSQLTRSDITKFFTDIFITGSNTSMVPVEWAMARLLQHPDKMEKVRAELEASLGSKAFVEESDLGKLPYLHAVLKETLRLHPPAPLVPRMVVADGGMSLGGFAVPRDTCVLINWWAIGRDPAAWPEPDEFVPERFLGDRARHYRGSDFAYRPFGAGRRVCPGMDLVERFVPLVLASILHRFRWTLPDGMAPEDVDIRDHFGTVLELATPLCAVPVYTV